MWLNLLENNNKKKMIEKLNENLNFKNPLNILSVIKKINEVIDKINTVWEKKVKDNSKNSETSDTTVEKNKISDAKPLRWRVVRKGNKMVLKSSTL